jgi:hypothetical protein
MAKKDIYCTATAFDSTGDCDCYCQHLATIDEDEGETFPSPAELPELYEAGIKETVKEAKRYFEENIGGTPSRIHVSLIITDEPEPTVIISTSEIPATPESLTVATIDNQ